MNTEKLLEYLSNPKTLNRDSLEEIQNLVQVFPYFRNAQLLYLFNLSNTQDIRFGEQLQKAASYAADRRLLKRQIEELKQSLSTPEEEDISKEAHSEKEPVNTDSFETAQAEIESGEKVTDNESVDLQLIVPSSVNSEKINDEKVSELEPLEDILDERNKIRSKVELLQLVKERLLEIELNEAKKSDDKISGEEAAKNSPLKSKSDIIDQFIQVEPRISRPEKTAFFDPDMAAQESVIDDGAYVTETLARIYSDQGNYLKAKEIYQILSLNNPEKSAYFAALIQELENKLN